MTTRRMMALCLAAGSALPVHAAEPAATVAAAFGARENIRQISLSPDGTHIAVIVSDGTRGTALAVADVAVGGPLKGILKSSGTAEHLTDCHWSSDTRLVCNIFMTSQDGIDRLAYTRSIAIDSDGRRVKVLSARTNDRSLQVMQNGGSVIDWTANGAVGSALMTRKSSPARNAERITAPVLMFHADQDMNVGIGESRLMASKLKAAGKQVELVEFRGLDHQIDDDAARAAMLARADEFLRTALKM